VFLRLNVPPSVTFCWRKKHDLMSLFILQVGHSQNC